MKPLNNFFRITTQKKIYFITQEEIIYLKSDGCYTLIQTKLGKIFSSKTLKSC